MVACIVSDTKNTYRTTHGLLRMIKTIISPLLSIIPLHPLFIKYDLILQGKSVKVKGMQAYISSECCDHGL